jgi:hypothetical protein
VHYHFFSPFEEIKKGQTLSDLPLKQASPSSNSRPQNFGTGADTPENIVSDKGVSPARADVLSTIVAAIAFLYRP